MTQCAASEVASVDKLPRTASCASQTYQTYRICLSFHGRLDLASFVTTWMEPEAEEIIAATQAINMVDVSQYPQCAEMEQRYAIMHCSEVCLTTCMPPGHHAGKQYALHHLVAVMVQTASSLHVLVHQTDSVNRIGCVCMLEHFHGWGDTQPVACFAGVCACWGACGMRPSPRVTMRRSSRWAPAQ